MFYTYQFTNKLVLCQFWGHQFLCSSCLISEHFHFSNHKKWPLISVKELMFYSTIWIVWFSITWSTNLAHNPAQNFMVMALWIWLEKIGYPSAIVVGLSDPLINAMFNEAETHAWSGYSSKHILNPNGGALPIIRIVMQMEIVKRWQVFSIELSLISYIILIELAIKIM